MGFIFFSHRYNGSSNENFTISKWHSENIGIELYSLNILRRPADLNLNYVQKRIKDKQRTYHLLLFEDTLFAEIAADELRKIFEIFWHKKVLNALIVYWSTVLNCITYSPFNNDKLIIVFNLNETDPKKLFYDKVQNLNGYELRVALFYEPSRAVFKQTQFTASDISTMDGIDGLLTQLVIKYLNATLRLIQPNDGADIGEIFSNGSSNGVLALLVNDTADVGFNARFLRSGRFLHLVEATITNGRDDICILVPRPGNASNLGNIFHSFSTVVWICILISLPLFTIIYQIFYNKHRHMVGLVSTVEQLTRFFGLNLNQPSNFVPKNIFARILFGIWIFYCLLITSAYSGHLTSFLLFRPRLPDIQTIKQFDQSGYNLLTLQRYSDSIQIFLNETRPNSTLFKRIYSIHSSDYIDYIKEYGTRYAYANKFHINSYILNTLSGHDVYNQMKECPVPYMVTYVLSYGSPYKGFINKIISYAQEAGLIDYWAKKNDREKLFRRTMNDLPVAVSFYNLQSAFFVFLFGCTVALCIFGLELANARWKKLKKK